MVTVPPSTLSTGPRIGVVVAHEAGHEDVLGMAAELGRRPDLLDPPALHDDDAVAHGERFLLVVRHVDERDAQVALEAAQLDAHAQLQQAVEVAERLVEQDRLRARDEHAGERDALLLAAGELARLAVRHRAEADHLDRVARLVFSRAALSMPRILRPKATFWRTLRCGKRAKCWKTVVTGRLAGGTPFSTSPSRLIVP